MSEKHNPSHEGAELEQTISEAPKETKESSATEALNQLLEHAKSGNLEPSDADQIDRILNNAAYPTLETIAKGITMSESEKNTVKQSEYFQVYLRLFTDKKSLAALKGFAPNAYEKDAAGNPKSEAFEKLRAFGNLAKNVGGDSEIADRFTLVEPEVESERVVVATKEDVEKYGARGIDIEEGSQLRTRSVKVPFWVFKK